MTSTKAQIKASQKYNAKTLDRITVSLPKGNKNILNAAAAAENKSLNKYITDIIVNYCKNNNIELIFREKE